MKKNARFALLTCLLGMALQVSLAQDLVGPVEIGQKYTLQSEVNGFEYELAVFLPEGYEEHKDSLTYPCLYLFIGGEDLFHSTSGITRILARHGEIPNMIIVGITNIRWWPDLTPEKIEWREDSGEAGDFLSFVSQQAIPFVDETYSTNDHRIYMGHSLGGMFGIYALTENKDLFDDFILISPSVQNRANSLFGKLETLVTTNKELDNDIYFTVGSEGNRMSKGSHRIATAFTNFEGANLRWKLEVMSDKNHFTTMLPTMVKGLKYVMEDEMKEQSGD